MNYDKLNRQFEETDFAIRVGDFVVSENGKVQGAVYRVLQNGSADVLYGKYSLANVPLGSLTIIEHNLTDLEDELTRLVRDPDMYKHLA